MFVQYFHSVSILVNTFGSGKTRLVLEGLCHHWGFYFVVKPDSAGIGSSDVYQIIEKLHRIKRYSQAEDDWKKVKNPAVIQHMIDTLQWGLARALLARVLFFKFFIQTAQE